MQNIKRPTTWYILTLINIYPMISIFGFNNPFSSPKLKYAIIAFLNRPYFLEYV